MSVGGFSKVRLDRMHDVRAGHVERGQLPGIVALVSRRGEVSLEPPAGVSRRRGGARLDRRRLPGVRADDADFWTSAYEAIDD